MGKNLDYERFSLKQVTTINKQKVGFPTGCNQITAGNNVKGMLNPSNGQGTRSSPRGHSPLLNPSELPYTQTHTRIHVHTLMTYAHREHAEQSNMKVRMRCSWRQSI